MISSWTKLSYGARIISGKTALLALVSGLLPTLGACSPGKSDFADANISAEAQGRFNMYEKLKDHPGFKERLNIKFAVKPDYSLNTSFDVTAKGRLYKDAHQIYRRNAKVHNFGFNGTYAEFLKKHGARIGNVEIRDFQLADDIKADNLQANGSKEALSQLLKKYSAEDFVKAARVELIVATLLQFSEPEKSDALNLAEDGLSESTPWGAAGRVGAAGADALGEMGKAAIDADAKRSSRDADANIKNACAESISQCARSGLTGAQRIWQRCSGLSDDPPAMVDVKMGNLGTFTLPTESEIYPSIELNQRVPRQNLAGSEGLAIWSNPYAGSGKCSKHYWTARCDEGNKKKDGKPDQYYHDDSNKVSCQWQHLDEKSPKSPMLDKDFVEGQKSSCAATAACNINVNIHSVDGGTSGPN